MRTGIHAVRFTISVSLKVPVEQDASAIVIMYEMPSHLSNMTFSGQTHPKAISPPPKFSNSQGATATCRAHARLTVCQTRRQPLGYSIFSYCLWYLDHRDLHHHYRHHQYFLSGGKTKGCISGAGSRSGIYRSFLQSLKPVHSTTQPFRSLALPGV